MASDRYEQEISFLQDLTHETLRELEYLIFAGSKPCESFEARSLHVNKCRRCAYGYEKHGQYRGTF